MGPVRGKGIVIALVTVIAIAVAIAAYVLFKPVWGKL